MAKLKLRKAGLMRPGFFEYSAAESHLDNKTLVSFPKPLPECLWYYQFKGGIRYIQMDVQLSELNPAVLDAVKAIARANSSTLGFLPSGAINGYASKGQIIVAVDSQSTLAGYLIYGVSKLRASLIHLCVIEKYRRLGVARFLFRSLVERTKYLRGVYVRCRRDFPANHVWPTLGFTAIGEMPGRGKKNTILTEWWLAHPHKTLFSSIQGTSSNPPPTDLVIDANIFYDLHFEREHSEESRSLTADWVSGEIRLCVTPELFNEINRLQEPEKRAEQRSWAHLYERVAGPDEDYHKSYRQLAEILGNPTNPSGKSDPRHLAHVAAAGVRFFITRDQEVLNHREEIESQLGVVVLRPAAFIMQVDQYRNEQDYHPARLAGSQIRISRVMPGQIEKVVQLFRDDTHNEPVSSFRTHFSRLLSSPGFVSAWLIQNEGLPLALFVTDQSHDKILEIPCLRVRRGPFASTIARHTVKMAIDTSVLKTYPITRVTDPYLRVTVLDALEQSQFLEMSQGWTKLNLFNTGTASKTAGYFRELVEAASNEGLIGQEWGHLAEMIETASGAENVAELERALFPAKILECDLPTYIISIKPFWAYHLFDEKLAAQTMFGAETRLALSWENVYYRAPRWFDSGYRGPFRILWYVSSDRRFDASKSIRASSQAWDAEILKARDAFRKYRRLGVYEWPNVLRQAKGDPDGKVMVIQFRDTELFRHPIPFNEASKIIKRVDGRPPVLQGPYRISDSSFFELYECGTGRICS